MPPTTTSTPPAIAAVRSFPLRRHATTNPAMPNPSTTIPGNAGMRSVSASPRPIRSPQTTVSGSTRAKFAPCGVKLSSVNS